jgi:hypothetical protein
MINIDIFGKPGALTRRETKHAVKFYAEALLGPKLSQNLDIMLTFEKDGMADGHCFAVDEGRHGSRVFEVSINPKMSRAKQLKVLAHEMVHVKQYARKELKEHDIHTAYWMGKKWKLSDKLINYLFYPWEIEANGTERALSQLYKLSLAQKKRG